MVHGERLALAPELASIRQAGDWLHRIGQEFGVPKKSINRLDVCLHEVLANVLTHGGPSAFDEDIVLTFRARLDEAGGEVCLEVQDAGEPFDPVSRIPATGAQSLDTVEPGGLGIIMIRSNADQLEYRREHGLNHLRMTLGWKRSGS